MHSFPQGERSPVPRDGHALQPWISESESSTIDLRESMVTLRRNWGLVLLTTALCTGIAGWVVSRESPRYSARVVLRMEDPRSALAGRYDAGYVDWVMWRTNPLITESVVLEENRELAGAVADREGLRLRVVSEGFSRGELEGVVVGPEAAADSLTLAFGPDEVAVRGLQREVRGAYGEPLELEGVRFTVPVRPQVPEARLRVVSREAAIGVVMGGLQANPRTETNLIDLDYGSDDPVMAQRVVNAIAEEFQAYDLARHQQISVQRMTFIEEQIDQMGDLLTDAYGALNEFRRRSQVYDSEEMISAFQNNLLDLEARREQLVADRDAGLAILEDFRLRDEGSQEWVGGATAVPGMAEDPTIDGLRSQLGEYTREREERITGEWGDWTGHPDVKRLDGLIAATELKLVEAIRNHVTSLDARISGLDELQARRVASMDALSDTEMEETWLLHEVETIRSILEQLRVEYQRARISESVEIPRVAIMGRATVPGALQETHANAKIALGLLLGLVLGSGSAFVREGLNTSIRHREELESVLGVPALAVIPRITSLAPAALLRLPGGRSLEKPRSEGLGLVTATDVLSSGAEAYRMLRTNLRFSNAVQELRTILVTSASAAEGKTTTAANLAVSIAQQGMRVALIDGDVRRPRLHSIFSVPREPGLTDFLIEAHPVSDVVHPTPVPGLFFIPAGSFPPNPADLLGIERMQRLIESLAEGFDLVVIDSPPVLTASESTVLSLQVDGTLMVVCAGRTDRGAVQHAIRQLATVGGHVIGAVLNDPDQKVPTYHRYYYSYAPARSSKAPAEERGDPSF